MMWHIKLSIKLLFASTICFYTFTYPLKAQTIPDRSLGNENSVVKQNVTIKDSIADLIEGGAIRENNLFHSFEKFNVPDGSSVYFSSPDGVANILTRITGNNISEIFGTLGVNGNANLFLLNPNGIVFGENAALDVNGSFLATTAENYIFENGFKYSATNPEIPPLLTINIPVGVQMGAESATIEVRGTGNNLTQEEFTLAPIKSNRPIGLEVKSGNTLALLGGEINLIGGNLTAARGNVELGSVREANTVSLNPTDKGFSINYEGINNFGDLNFTQASSVDVSGSGGGNINLWGKNISVLENSAIIANTLGIDDGGNLNAVASNTIEIISSDTDASFASSLSAFSEGKGDADNLIVKGENLVIRNGGRIDAGVIDEGNGGNVTIDVRDIAITGVDADGSYPSAIYVSSDGIGNSGNLNIRGNSIILKDGGQIDSGVTDAGNGGNVIIDVRDIAITGVDAEGYYPSAIYVSSEGEGNGGNLKITGNSLVVKDGGQLDSGVTDVGNGGNTIIEVKNIEIVGVAPDGSLPSVLYVSANGEGDAGNLTIKGDSLIVKDGGQLDSGVTDTGKAGNIDITAHNILVTGSSFNENFVSKMTATSKSTSTAGSIDITTRRLDVTKNGEIAVKNTNLGDAGNLTITAEEINIDNNGSLNAEINQGKQGNIDLIASNIWLNNDSQITTKASNNATGGNITINNSENLVLRNNSQIIADAVTGNGGNIKITTQGYFSDLGSDVSASSEFGLDGNVEVETISSDRPIELDSLPDNPIDASEKITAGCSIDNNFTIAGRGGFPDNPLQDLKNQTTWQDLRIPEFNYLKNNKEISLISQSPKIEEANNWLVNSQGNLELITDANKSNFLAFNSLKCLKYLVN